MNQPAGGAFAVSGNELSTAGTLRFGIEARTSSTAARPSGHAGWESTWEHRAVHAVAWTPTQRLTFTASLPVVLRVYEAPGDSSSARVALGDAEWMGHVHVVRTPDTFPIRHQLTLSAGLKMPTGWMSLTASGVLSPLGLQTGTGSWDPLVSMTYSVSGRRWTMVATASARIATMGFDGWTMGHTFNASIGPGFEFSTVFAGLATLDVRTSSNEVHNAQPVLGSSQTSVAISPSLLMTISPNVAVRLSVRVPVWNATPDALREDVSGSMMWILSPNLPRTQPSPATSTPASTRVIATNTSSSFSL